MNYITFDDFKKLSEFNNFIKDNPDKGYLKVQTFTAYQAIPIEGVEIIISKDIGNNRVIFFEGVTDENGMISNIELPAPPAQYIANENISPPYTTYDLNTRSQKYNSINKYTVAIFGDVRVIQYVKMNANSENGGASSGSQSS